MYSLLLSQYHFFSNLICVVSFKIDSETSGGVDLPKFTVNLCLDGVTRKQLVKGNDDMRQNSMMGQVFNIANQLLSKNMLAYHRLPQHQDVIGAAPFTKIWAGGLV